MVRVEKTSRSPGPSGIRNAPTGIAGQAEITEGGLRRGRPTLVRGSVGSDLADLAGRELLAVVGHSDGSGRGSRFTVRLPLLVGSTTAEPAAAAPSLPEAPVADLRVLVVDDNVDNAETLSQLIEMLGYRTLIAYDGVEAVESAGSFQPQVVLLDIGLPRLNGHDAARQIRSQPWGKDMLLVALSGWGQAEDKRRSIEAGFDHHLVKPVDLEPLMALLADLRPAGRAPDETA